MTRRIAVTGATGFLGRHAIAPLIKDGFEPHLLVRAAEPARALHGSNVGVSIVDLMDPASVRRALGEAQAQTLLHFAWHDDPATRWTSDANQAWADATLDLARAFAETGGERLLVSGSCAEYDWSTEVLSESTPLAPASPYGAAKVALYQQLRQEQAALGLSLVWGRVFFCYGPGEGPGRLIRDLIDRLMAGEPLNTTDGLQVRDYLHAGDVGRAFADLAGSGFDGAINIASGEGVAVRDLVGTAARMLGRPELVRYGANPRSPSDPARLVADVTLLRDTLGFRPLFDLETGLADTIADAKRSAAHA